MLHQIGSGKVESQVNFIANFRPSELDSLEWVVCGARTWVRSWRGGNYQQLSGFTLGSIWVCSKLCYWF